MYAQVNTPFRGRRNIRLWTTDAPAVQDIRLRNTFLFLVVLANMQDIRRSEDWRQELVVRKQLFCMHPFPNELLTFSRTFSLSCLQTILICDIVHLTGTKRTAHRNQGVGSAVQKSSSTVKRGNFTLSSSSSESLLLGSFLASDGRPRVSWSAASHFFFLAFPRRQSRRSTWRLRLFPFSVFKPGPELQSENRSRSAG